MINSLKKVTTAFAVRRELTDFVNIILFILVSLTGLTGLILTVALATAAEIFYRTSNRGRSLFDNAVFMMIPVAVFINQISTESDQSVSYWMLVSGVLMAAAVAITGPVKNIIKKRQVRYWFKGEEVFASSSLYEWSRLLSVYIFVVLVSLTFVVYIRFAYLIPIVIISLSAIAMLVWRKSQYTNDSSALQRAIDYRPKFAIFCGFSEPEHYAYIMWEKYFKQTNRSYVVIAHNERIAEEFSTMTDVPIVFCRDTDEKLKLIDNSEIKAVFYPVNSASNVVATQAMTSQHVFIGHGDSDKAPSFRRVTAMYDWIFVAGQAAIDRYKDNGVKILPDKFIITGRPQVEDIDASRGEIKTILYSPTWHGHTKDVDYTSLYEGVEIVEALINKGIRVIFRPHPRSYASPKLSSIIYKIHAILESDNLNNSRNNKYGSEAESNMSIFECFNESDAMISDVSSVIVDYIYSEKPIILIDTKNDRDKFIKNYPLSVAAYIFNSSLSGLHDTIDDLMSGHDDLGLKRKELKEHYLSKPNREQDYPSMFITAVNRLLE